MTEHNNPQDSVTVSRELLRQVLDATANLSLLFYRTREWGCLPMELVAARASEKALSAVLEQPAVEPAKFVCVDNLGGTEVVIRDPQLPKAATTPQAQQPQMLTTEEYTALAHRQVLKAELVRLFTPLTNEQIVECHRSTLNLLTDDTMQLVRAVEACHGITGESK